MCPIVPTLTWGFERSNFSFAICLSEWRGVKPRPTLRYGAPLYGAPNLFRSLNPCDHFFADVLRRLLVAIEVHRVGGATLRARPQVGRIAEHLRQRHARVHDLRTAAILLRLDAAP